MVAPVGAIEKAAQILSSFDTRAGKKLLTGVDLIILFSITRKHIGLKHG